MQLGILCVTTPACHHHPGGVGELEYPLTGHHLKAVDHPNQFHSILLPKNGSRPVIIVAIDKSIIMHTSSSSSAGCIASPEIHNCKGDKFLAVDRG